MVTLLILLAFSKEIRKDASPKLCDIKPWLCETQNCPPNEERIDEFCHCKVGFTRNPKTKACEPIL